ncbi:hypothetical protein HYH03_012106 [Edaphochlamys debaryana]|uniref:Uncharacterized protein n=1 Tax=Edaphochlamys debaryana TaxID=47281 RepID=A0A835XYZ1_9CHLO|nr:hypothetical protein HYH03_012106 [Edaphochlamys debaryana]|eukprot:KAG2489470.1 hypothetical protein HYH03_012106 [Edaphochlamys debaryana]
MWYTGNSGVTTANITVYFTASLYVKQVGVYVVYKGSAKSNIAGSLTLITTSNTQLGTSCASDPATACGPSTPAYWYTCNLTTLNLVNGMIFTVQDNGYKPFPAKPSATVSAAQPGPPEPTTTLAASQPGAPKPSASFPTSKPIPAKPSSSFPASEPRTAKPPAPVTTT